MKKEEQSQKAETVKKAETTKKAGTAKKAETTAKSETTIEEQATRKGAPKWVETLQKHREDGKNWYFIWGYDGGSNKDGKRIYLDASLQQALEVPNKAILHAEKSSLNLDGEVYLWIDQELWGECLYLYTS